MNTNKCAVFVLLGQSNAVGHALPMKEEDIIGEPMKNVFGLTREHNQSFDNDALLWSGYTSFGMNLAEEQDNTYSVANCLARAWQSHIDSGNKCGLPDLYIVQIAIGAQGVTDKYMWYPERKKILIPGVLGKVDISMFPLATHVFSLLGDSFRKMGKEYEIIGIHWRGGEEDAGVEREYLERELQGIYARIFDKFNGLLDFPPIVLHKIVCFERYDDLDVTGRQRENAHLINSVFENLSEEYSNVDIFDVTTAPQYVPNVRGNGIFMSDVVHFTPEVNKWVSGKILADFVAKKEKE